MFILNLLELVFVVLLFVLIMSASFVIFILWLALSLAFVFHMVWCIVFTWDFFIMGFIFKLVASSSCTCINCLLQIIDHWCPYKKQSIYRDTWMPSVVLASSVEMFLTYVVHQYIKFSLNHTLVPHTEILPSHFSPNRRLSLLRPSSSLGYGYTCNPCTSHNGLFHNLIHILSVHKRDNFVRIRTITCMPAGITTNLGN